MGNWSAGRGGGEWAADLPRADGKERDSEHRFFSGFESVMLVERRTIRLMRKTCSPNPLPVSGLICRVVSASLAVDRRVLLFLRSRNCRRHPGLAFIKNTAVFGNLRPLLVPTALISQLFREHGDPR